MNPLTSAKHLVGRLLLHRRVAATLIALFRGQIPSRGFVFDVNTPYIAPRNAARLVWRAYEVDEIHLLRAHLRRDLDVVEYGSGIGVISLEIARHQNPQHKLVCVEANPHLIAALEKNLRRNLPAKEVRVLNCALDYSGAEQVTLYVTANNLGTRVEEVGAGQRTVVAASTLNDLLARCAIAEYALVCDVEGAEAGLICEDGAALARCRQMLIELHPTIHNGQPYRVEQLRDRLNAQGFQIVAQRHNVFFFTRPA